MATYLSILKAQRTALLQKHGFVHQRPSPEDGLQWEAPCHVKHNVLAELGKLDARISMVERGRAMHWINYALVYAFRPRGMSFASLIRWYGSQP